MTRNLLLSFASIAVMSAALAAVRDANGQVLSPSATSTSTSGAAANAGSSSGSTSGSTVLLDQSSRGSGNVYNPAAPTDVTVRSAPQVFVPSVVTGNVCALGASAGASFIGTGFAVGGSWESAQCENRQRAALLHNMGYKEAARELACNNRETYEAMKRSGIPCAMRPEWEPAGTVVTQPPVRVTAPLPTYVPPPPSPMQEKVYPRCNPRQGITDNCQS